VYEYRARIIKRVDADTLHLEVDLGLDCRLRLTVRLAGINAPELSTAEGKEAAAFVDAWLVENAPDGMVLLRTVKDTREKYGRYLGVLFPLAILDGASVTDLSAALLSAGRAVVYP
jgi:micrococcal nuclease